MMGLQPALLVQLKVHERNYEAIISTASLMTTVSPEVGERLRQRNAPYICLDTLVASARLHLPGHYHRSGSRPIPSATRAPLIPISLREECRLKSSDGIPHAKDVNNELRSFRREREM